MAKIATDPDFIVEIDYDRLFIEKSGIDGGLMFRVQTITYCNSNKSVLAQIFELELNTYRLVR